MLSIDRQAFFDHIRPLFPSGRISPDQLARIEPLLNAVVAHPTLNASQAAYILATAFHETDCFRAMTEYASGASYEGRASLGNTQPGDGVRFKGRGYVMITGRRNYSWGAQFLGVDLLGNPELAALPQHAAPLVIHGMLTGAYTGRKLGEFISETHSDFEGARRVVNGTDKAASIALYAKRFLSALRASHEPEPSAASGPVVFTADGDLTSVPAGPSPEPQKTFGHAMACGTSVMVVWSAIVATGILPPSLSTPEVTSAIGGILSALASSLGLCNYFPFNR